jgi:hypothetical protein
MDNPAETQTAETPEESPKETIVLLGAIVILKDPFSGGLNGHRFKDGVAFVPYETDLTDITDQIEKVIPIEIAAGNDDVFLVRDELIKRLTQ